VYKRAAWWQNKPGDSVWRWWQTRVVWHVFWSWEGEKRVAGGAVGEVAGGASVFYSAGGEGAEAVGRRLVGSSTDGR
jgi:hypothetical protein